MTSRYANLGYHRVMTAFSRSKLLAVPTSWLRIAALPVERAAGKACVGLRPITWVAVSCASTALADSVQFGGGALTGKVSGRGSTVIIEVDEGLKVAVREGRVRGRVASDQLATYKRLAAEAGDDAERHYRLARWCAAPGNLPAASKAYRRFHYRLAVELDPDHAEARAALGYKKTDDNRWVKTDDLMRKRGMVRVKGKWQLPEAVALEEARDSTNVESKQWVRELRRMLAIIQRGSSKSDEAFAELQAIDDPLAAAAVAQQLFESRDTPLVNPRMRMLWVNLLARFRTATSVEALVRTGLNDPDAAIREAALTHLQDYGASSAVATYLPMLKSNDNRLVNQAAQALQWFPDPELVMTYIDALNTKHSAVIPAGPGMQVGFGPNGGGGLQTGGKPVKIDKTISNPSVRTLLEMVEPDVNFGYNERQWREHIAARRNTYRGDLRRDP